MRIEDADAIDDYHRAPAPLMPVEEFAAEIQRLGGTSSTTVQFAAAAYRRAISEVGRLSREVDKWGERVQSMGADVISTCAENDRLRSEVERVTKDAERLDWLEKQVTHDIRAWAWIGENGNGWTVKDDTSGSPRWEGDGFTLREAIDVARGAVRGDAAIREDAGADTAGAETAESPVQPPREDAPSDTNG